MLQARRSSLLLASFSTHLVPLQSQPSLSTFLEPHYLPAGHLAQACHFQLVLLLQEASLPLPRIMPQARQFSPALDLFPTRLVPVQSPQSLSTFQAPRLLPVGHPAQARRFRLALHLLSRA